MAPAASAMPAPSPVCLPPAPGIITVPGPRSPGAVADENALPDGEGAIVPDQQEVEHFVRHPEEKKQPQDGGSRYETWTGCGQPTEC